MTPLAHQTPLSVEFSRQEYWSELLFSSPGHLPDPRIEPVSPALQADSLPSEPPGKPMKVVKRINSKISHQKEKYFYSFNFASI